MRLRVAVIAILVAVPSLALAFAAGAPGRVSSGCNSCHTGFTAPTIVEIKGPSTLIVGEKATYTVDIVSSASLKFAGIDVGTSDGTLSVNAAGPPTKLSSGEIVNSAKGGPAPNTYTFDLTAPGTPGIVTLNAQGLAADGDNGTFGDKSAAATPFTITVNDPPDLAGLDLFGVDMMPPPSDLTAGPAFDLIDVHDPVKRDEPRWVCGCRLGAAPAAPPSLSILALGLLVALALRSRRRWRAR